MPALRNHRHGIRPRGRLQLVPPRKKKNPTVITSESVEDPVQEFDSFDEAYAALMAQLDPGGSIDLHEETCALAVDGPECTCTPHRITKGATA